MKKEFNIKAFYPNFFDGILIAYVCFEIIKNWNCSSIHTMAMGFASDQTMDNFKEPSTTRKYSRKNSKNTKVLYKDAFTNKLAWMFVKRFFKTSQIKRLAEKKFLRTLNHQDIAYLWPGSTIDLYRKTKSRGHMILAERINTLRTESRAILDQECAALNLTPNHNMVDKDISNEVTCMELADYLFSPSPAVTKSIIDAGIPTAKIIQTSYGLRSSDILGKSEKSYEAKPVTAIFVGSICVRKGIHLLLKAWTKANIDGKLIIVGRVDPLVQTLFSEHQKLDPSIEHCNYVTDLKPLYRDADFFILPSLEEGSPLVTYLALGASLPVVVSPMGAGGIIDDGKEGFIVDPHDEDALAGAITKMAESPELRMEMGHCAGEKAPHFVWEKVAARRLESLLSKISGEQLG